MLKLAMFDTKPYDRAAFEAIQGDFDVDIKFFDANLTEDTVSLAEGYDAVIPFVNDTVNDRVIDALASRNIKLVALRCAGYNNVDLRAAKDKITVMRVPAYSPYAVAEHAMAMLLTIIRRTHKAYIRTRDFNFSLSGMVGFDLHGKTVGVIGTGRIGRVFIDICRGFGMRVIAYDVYPAKDSGIEYVSLNDLFRQSDIISLHCPLTEDTHHLINGYSMQYMKKGVVIVNTSRGALIDAEALLSGIKSRQIGAACLDVYEEEGDVFFEDFSGHIMEDDTLARLISMPNVLVTSHQAFLTQEALANIAQTTLQNVTDFFAGKTNGNEVR
ncbi:MAG: 2-hydroxyacid dehydrogenase [Clostridia bacterium]|nr:2-hydroxyacid dehydrogenase [Clostridia bacterium]